MRSTTKKQPQQETFINIVHSKRLKPLKKQPAVNCVEAVKTIDQAYLAELAGSEEYISIAFCYKNYNEEMNPRLSENESCAVISVAKAKELLHTEVLAEEALTAVSIILFSAVSQTFGGFLTDGETNKRYVLSKGTEYAGLTSL
ncbi:hypothetical protein ES754_11380 [Psychrobacter frigidicola]|uniref:Uncharacterized protein n=1 Tax=Psychrobacter frigidicola TaxID=45611 RepID=A0A5C6ZZG2_9GAMM|nr:hypothetical protein [Psychrobacter frigidicola]TXD96228.1 hypothetical protein ES754_11380 [Psychrobacter frigidicola]